MSEKADAKATGGCLCGGVRYEIQGPVRDVVNCHCSKCRRFLGNFGAYTMTKESKLKLLQDKSLKWYRSLSDETPNVHRGFCSECGSSLFWHPRDTDLMAVTAGSLDQPTGLKTIGHVWVSQRGDYYQLDDGLPQFQERWEG